MVWVQFGKETCIDYIHSPGFKCLMNTFYHLNGFFSKDNVFFFKLECEKPGYFFKLGYFFFTLYKLFHFVRQ